MATPKYVVTGSTGHLGRLAAQALIARGVAPSQIVATGRATDRIADLAARGVVVKRSDFEDPASLRAAFAGTDRLLLVSSSALGKRLAHHRNAIEAAKAAGVSFVAYTSIANAPTSHMSLGPEHAGTEAALRESGLAHVILRNSWYFENYTDRIATTVEQGVLLGAAGEARIHAATRADYAEAAAIAITQDGHAGRAYELGGDQGFTLAEYAAEVARQSGKPVVYRNLPNEEYRRALVGFGMPEPIAALYASFDDGIAHGDLVVTSGALAKLLGRPATSLRDAVKAALVAAKVG